MVTDCMLCREELERGSGRITGTVVIQTEAGLALAGMGAGQGEEWLDSGCILKVEPDDFLTGLIWSIRKESRKIPFFLIEVKFT